MAKKRGRPAFKPTVTMRRKVEELVSCGMVELDIARAIGCAHDTLRKHFVEELLTGRAKRRAEVIWLRFREARKGQSGSLTQLEKLTALEPSPPAPEPPAEKPEKLGKKELASLEAAKPVEDDGKSRWSGLLN